MARPPKPTELHVLNGNPSRKTLPTARILGTDKPLGAAPTSLTKSQQSHWRRVRKEMPWLNMTNREVVKLLCIELDNKALFENYFEERKKATDMMGKAQHPALAYIQFETGSQDPVALVLSRTTILVKQLLSELGSTPTTQARILAQLAARAERDAEDDPEFKYLKR